MNNKMIRASVLMTVITVLFTLAVCFIDVQAIGPQNTEVGFASVNMLVRDSLGLHMFWYGVTEFLGYLAIAVCVLFAVIGFCQVLKRKNLFKVDRDIVSLGIIYVIVILTYVLFEKNPLNFRPIIMPGKAEIEASFPSSHTMLACTVFGTAIIEIRKRLEGKKICTILEIVAWILLTVTVVGRILSGVHWITDIFGGIFFSFTYILWFVSFAFNYGEN